MKVSGVDFKKQLKQLHVRPFILLRLLYFLLDQGHEVGVNVPRDVSVGDVIMCTDRYECTCILARFS